MVAVLKSRGTGLVCGEGDMANSQLFEYSLRRKSVICWSVSLFSNSCDKGQEMAVEVVYLRERGEVQTIPVPL